MEYKEALKRVLALAEGIVREDMEFHKPNVQACRMISQHL
jgi:hypothetical protein